MKVLKDVAKGVVELLKEKFNLDVKALDRLNLFLKRVVENKYIVMSGTGYIKENRGECLPLISNSRQEAEKFGLVEALELVELLYENGLEGVIRKA